MTNGVSAEIAESARYGDEQISALFQHCKVHLRRTRQNYDFQLMVKRCRVPLTSHAHKEDDTESTQPCLTVLHYTGKLREARCNPSCYGLH